MFGRPNLPKQLQTKTPANTRCQKCLKLGHATYECKNARPYTARPSRSKELAAAKGIGSAVRAQPSVEVPDEFKSRDGLADRILKAKEAEREREAARAKGTSKGKERDGRGSSRRRRYSSSSSVSSASDFDSGSDSDSDSESRGGRRSVSSTPSSRPHRSTNHTESRSRSPPPHKARRYSTTKDRSPVPRKDSESPPRRHRE